MALQNLSKFSRIFFGSRRFTPLSHRISPELERVGGQVVIDRADDQQAQAQPQPQPQPLPSQDGSVDNIPMSIDMLVRNNVEVPADLLLRALPWGVALNSPTTNTPESIARTAELNQLYEQLLRWTAKGDVVNAAYAVNICYRMGTYLYLRDIDHVISSVKSEQGLDDLFKQVFGEEIDFEKIKSRYEQVLRLLEEGKVSEAHQRAQATINSINSAHLVLESVEKKVYDAQAELSDAKLKALGLAGVCLVVGVSCSYLATIPELSLPILEGAITNIAAMGAVVCLTAGTALYLRSPQFKTYLNRLRDVRAEYRSLRYKLDKSVEECFDRGFNPAL